MGPRRGAAVVSRNLAIALAIGGVALIGAGVGVVLGARGGLEEQLRQRVVEEAEQRLGGTVELDRVRVAGPSEVTLEGLRWTPAGGRLSSLQADAVDLTADARALLDGDARLEGATLRGVALELRRSAPTGDASTAPLAAGEGGTARLLREAMEHTGDPLAGELAEAVRELQAHTTAGAAVTLDGGVVRGLPGGGEAQLEQAALRVAEDRVDLDGSGTISGAGRFVLAAALVPGEPVAGSLEVEDAPLAVVSERLPLLEGADHEGGVVDLGFSAQVLDSGVPAWTVSFTLDEMVARLPEFNHLPLEIDTRHELELRPDPGAARLEITDWRWSFNGVPGTGSGSILGLDGEPELRLAIQLREVPYDRIVGALPEGVLPEEWGIELGGTLDLTVRIGGPLGDREAWDLGWKGDWTRLHLRHSQLDTAFDNLLDGFPYFIEQEDGTALHRTMGPSDPHFIPLQLIHPHLVSAVVVCEDASFWAHAGFDEAELREAILENLREDGGGRGGSTITQQVAKNLFLSGDRTMTRKIQEALLAWRIEGTVPKQRIIEIYLNRAELGPGIWGVRDAAHHYFGTSTKQLNTRECVFLATMLPSPVRYHDYYHPRGQVTSKWDEHMAQVLYRMFRQGYLSEREYETALHAPLRFVPCDRYGGAGASVEPGR